MVRKILTIYFEGTSNNIYNYTTQISLFSFITNSYHLNPSSSSSSSNNNNNKEEYLLNNTFKISFNGCGITNGILGLIFAIGLKEQCYIILRHINYILEVTNELIINIIGLSRGGIAVIYLIKLINQLNTNKIKLNLLLFDPVPGNLICISKYLDICSFSTANTSLDISECKYINSILALYPYLPLPDLAFHAPLFPKYPTYCKDNIIEDACLGCHQGALFCYRNIESKLSFLRIKEWLELHGTPLKIDNDTNQYYVNELNITYEECIEVMNREISKKSNSNQDDVVRYGHSKHSNTFIRRNNQVPCQYLNKWHEELCNRRGDNNNMNNNGDESKKKYMLEIIREMK